MTIDKFFLRSKKIKKIIKKCSLIYNIFKWFNQEKEIYDWKKAGRPIPLPHLMKQRIVKEYARCFKKNVLVETGTYSGSMVYAVRNVFKEIYSIELDNKLFEQAKQRFIGYSHIHIVHGDSGELLPKILESLSKPCLFWLDAHYSGGITARGAQETPIMKELGYVFDKARPGFVILIDDARFFTGKDDYPTIKQLQSFVLQRNPELVFEVEKDIIRIHRYEKNRPN